MAEKIKKSDIEDIVEINSVQEGMLFHYLEDPTSDCYFEQICLEIESNIIPDRIKWAWEKVVENNWALRSVFRWDGLEQPIQVILKKADLNFILYDFSNIKNEGDLQDKCRSLIMEDRKNVFSLKKIPFRITLCKKSEREALLIISNHHIILDGWSTGIILNQFMNFYNNDNYNAESQIFKLSDYARYIRSFNYTEGIDYWKKYLINIDSPTLLKGTYSGKGSGNNCSFKIKSNIVYEFAKNNKITLAEFFYFAWALLLRIYLNCEDVVFGTTISGRNIAVSGINKAVGLFINTLPIRVKISDNSSVGEMISNIRKSLVNRQEYEIISQSKINQALNMERSEPMYDSIVVVENYPLDKIGNEENIIIVKDYSIFEKTNYNVTVNISEQKEFIKVQILYNNNIFSDEYIYNMLNHFENIIMNIIESGLAEKCLDIKILSKEEKSKIEAFNNTSCDYNYSSCIHYEFEKNVVRDPDKIAVKYDGQSMTYGELNNVANYYAQKLKNADVERNSIVGIYFKRSFEMMIAIFAVLKAGGAYMPIAVDIPEERLQYIINDSGVKTILTDSDFNDKFYNNSQLNIINVDCSDYNDTVVYDNPVHINEMNDLLYIIYTSGTTGNPKGVMIEHHSLMNRIGWMDKAYPIDDGDTVLQKTPYTFDVSVWELLWWSQKGACICFLKQGNEKNPLMFVDEINKNNITVMHFVPAMFSVFIEYLEDNEEDTDKISSLKRIFTSGEALSANQVNRFYKVNDNAEIVNLYGPTEATIDVSYYNCVRGKNYEKIPIGKPIDNTKLYIVNSANNIQPIGVIGELCICGVNLARGYLNKPELTNEKFCSGSKDINQRFYKTGDIARLMPDGNIEYLGRCDNQVKIRGLRIELGEIENVIERYDGISEVAVAVKKSSLGDNQIIAYYILKNPDEKLDLNDLKKFILRYSPEYMIPAYFIEVSEMPRSSNGKINRKELLKLNIENDNNIEYKAPETPIQVKISEIWRTLIDIEKISVYDNFFMIGGDSIRAIRLVSKLNKVFGVNIKISDLYHNSTIYDLEKVIINYDKSKQAEDVVRDRIKSELDESSKKFLAMTENDNNIEDIFQLTDIQNGMLLYYLKDEKKDIYFEQFVFEARYKDFDSVKYKKALELVTMENPILRTSFDMDNYLQPVQIVYKNSEIEYSYINFDNKDDAKKYIEKKLKEDKSRKFEIIRDEKLWRFMVISINNDFEYFIITCHHAILDGWSVNYMMALIHERYKNLLLEQEYSVQALGVTYKDALIDEKTEKCNAEHRKFWYNELSDYNRLNLDVCYDHNRAEVDERITKIHVYDKDLYDRLKSVAKDMNTSVKNICFGAYIYILKILSGQNDFVVGFLTNNRTVHENGDKVLGCYLNTVPVRVKIPYGISWRQFQRQIDSRLLEIKKHERMPLFEISQIIGEKTSSNIFFDTLYNYMDFSMIKDLDTEDLINSSTVYEGHQDTNTLFDFMLDVSMGQMKLTLRYTTSVLANGSDEYIFEYFKNILNHYINKCDHVIDTDSILSDNEKDLVINKFNDTDVEYDREITLNELFEKSVLFHSNNNAVIYSDGRKLTYDELNKNSNRIANMLREKGIKRNEFVAVIMERSPEMIEAIMGILKAGGAYLPVETYIPNARLRTMLELTGASKIITSDSLMDRVREVTADMDIKTIVSVDDSILKTYGENTPISINESTDIAYVIFTSGTTGTPKGVYVNHMTVVNVLEWVTNNYNINENDKLLFVTSICFDLSVYDMFGILSVGGTLRLTDSEELQEPEKLLDIINAENITFWDSAPQALMRLVPFMSDMTNKNTSLRLVFLSGDWIPVTLPDELRARFENVKVVSLGGATEATIWSNYYNIDSVQSTWKSIPYGMPMQNARYYVLGDNYSIRPIGTPGELYIGGINGDCLALGYINDKKLTDSKFVPSPFNENERLYKTGDLARWYKNGTLEFLGRADDQVKIHGYRIEIEEIERHLLQLEGIKQAVVIVKESRDFEKYLCAFVVAYDSINEETIKNKLSDVLPKYMLPSHIVILDSIPMTNNGKVDKKKLDNYEISVVPLVCNYAETQIQKQIEEIWKEVLDVNECIPIDISFYGYGGNSLNASMIVARINKKFGINITLKEFFSHTTISEQAEIVELNDNRTEHTTNLFESVQREYYPLSSAQERMYVLNELEHSTNYNATSFIKINGKIDYNRVDQAFRKIIERHSVFRSAFVKNNGSIKQFVMDNVDFRIDVVEVGTGDVDEAIRECIRVFDLSEPPFIRVSLLKISDEEHILVMDLHHIISDGISMNIITEEFLKLYRGDECEEVGVQYKDYAVWEKESSEYRDMIAKQEKYWESVLGKDLPNIQLPYDYERFNVKNSKGARKYFNISKDKTDLLKELAKENKSRLFHVLLAAYYLMLHKFSKQNDIIIGTAIANRRFAEVEKMLGVFANSLPLRCSVDSKLKFIDFLKYVTEQFDCAEENQEYPFDEMVRKFNKQRDLSRNSFFDVFFIMQTIKALNTNFGEFNVEPYHYNGNTAKFDLFLEVFDVNGELDLSFEYSTKLFKEETIEKFVDTYIEIINRLSADNAEQTTIAEILDINIYERNNILTITSEDMRWFESISHDYNPLHVDEKYSDATVYGERVVYGVLGTLKALSMFIANNLETVHIKYLDVQFRNPLFINKKYDCVYEYIDDGKVNIEIRSGESINTLITVVYDNDLIRKCEYGKEAVWSNDYDVAADPSLSQITKFNEMGEYSLSVNTDNAGMLKQMNVDNYVVCVMSFASWLVGMKNPGKRALFLNLRINFEGIDDYFKTKYFVKTVSFDDEFKKIKMKGILNSENSSANVIIETLIRPEISWSYNNSVSVLEGSVLSGCSDFKGKNVLIIGGSRGLGVDISFQMASLGANVFICYAHNEEMACSAMEQIKSNGHNAVALCADITVPEKVEKLYSGIIAEYGEIDIVINCAYPHIKNDSVENFNFDDFDERVGVPLKMTLNVLNVVAPGLNKNSGRYVCISSDYAKNIENDYFSYCIAKASIEKAVLHFEKKYTNIRFTIVRPCKFLSNQTATNLTQKYLCSSSIISADILEILRSSVNEKLVVENISNELKLEPLKKTNKTVNTVISSTFTADVFNEYIFKWTNVFGIDTNISVAPYNQVFQQLFEKDSQLRKNDGVSILLVRFEDWINESDDDNKIISVVDNYFDKMLSAILGIDFASNVIIGIFKSNYSKRLSEAVSDHIEILYEKLMDSLSVKNNIYFVDLTNTESYGVVSEYDDKKYSEAKIPFTTECVIAMGTEIARKIVSIYRQQCKVIILDCDNTMWRGIIAEDGVNGIEITDEYRYLQEFMKKQYENGRLLAVCSKNDIDNLMPVFERTDMILKKEMFVDIIANWNPKYLNVQQLVQKLNLSAESCVFIDDDYFECRQMTEKCPEVFTLQLPEDKTEIRAMLEKVWLFDINMTTSEDRERTQMYQEAIERQNSMDISESIEDFLSNLHIKVDISDLNENDIERASQMTYRTNQFNLSTKRRIISELKVLLDSSDYICKKVVVADDFGSYGMSGLIIAKNTDGRLIIDTFLLSCRVLGKNVENSVLSGVKRICELNNISKIEAEYIRTERNGLVFDFFNSKEYCIASSDEERTIFYFDSSSIEEGPEYIELSFDNDEEKSNKLCVRLNHLGLAVRDINESGKLFLDMGYTKGNEYMLLNQNSKLCIFTRNGYNDIEFVKPLDYDSPTTDILNENKLKFYHLCFEVESINGFLEYIKEKGIGYSIVSDAKEAEIFNNAPVSFIFVDNIGLIELLEIKQIEIVKNVKKDVLKLRINNKANAVDFLELIGYKKVGNSSYTDSMIFRKKYESDIEVTVVDEDIVHSSRDYIEGIKYLYCDKMAERLNKHGYLFIDYAGECSVINEIPGLFFDYIQKNNEKSADYKWNIIKMQKHADYTKPLIYDTAERILTFFKSKVKEEKTTAKGWLSVERDIEQKLIDIWCDVLKVNADEVDPNQNFFVGGANSFALIEMNSKLKDELDVDIELIKLFEYPTIRLFAEYIESITMPKAESVVEKVKQNSNLKKNKQTMLKTLDTLRRR